MACQPERGWNLLCNGVVVFDDSGELLLMARARGLAAAPRHEPARRALRADLPARGDLHTQPIALGRQIFASTGVNDGDGLRWMTTRASSTRELMPSLRKIWRI